MQIAQRYDVVEGGILLVEYGEGSLSIVPPPLPLTTMSRIQPLSVVMEIQGRLCPSSLNVFDDELRMKTTVCVCVCASIYIYCR